MVNYTGTVMTNGYDREMDNRHVLRISALLHLWFNGKLLQRGRIAELQRTSESYIICYLVGMSQVRSATVCISDRVCCFLKESLH